MPEGTPGPLSQDAPVTVAPKDAIVVDGAGEQRAVPPFPVHAAERGIEALSRFAGPAVFFLAIGALVWVIAG